MGSERGPASQWNETEKKWTGDVPDYPATMDPKSPKAWGPFIMNGEGVGRLFSSSMLDGPFPEHYEPMEAPIPNPLHPKPVGVAGRVPLRQGRRPGRTASAP